MSDIDLPSPVVLRWGIPALAVFCFLLAICCFIVASKLGCGCAGHSDAAHFKVEDFTASH
jgi:hypothetical protein